MTDPVPPAVVAALSRAQLPPLVFHRTVTSTNDVAMTLAASGAPELTAVLADMQSAGRGRQGREWLSPAGAGLYLSTFVRSAGLDAGASLLTLAAGVAVAETIGTVVGLPVELKWPNDVVIGRPWRKLAGILCEASGLGSDSGVIVIGMGVNVSPAAYPPEIAGRATSLQTEASFEVDADRVAALVAGCLVRLRDLVADLRRRDAAGILERWRAFGREGLNCAPVRWTDERGLCQGIAYGIGDDGALLVRRSDRADAPESARLERVVSGNVTWEMLSRG